MSKLIWDADGTRLFETGVKNGVLYPRASTGTVPYPTGVAWNGLSAITEKPTGADATKVYADDIKYLSMRAAEEYEATVEAYMYPDEFAECDGSANLLTGVTIGQQARKAFGLCYRTAVGNDVDGDAYGYKLHLIYGATASPSEKAYNTVNDSPEATAFSWDLETTPVNVTGHKPTATLTIDSTKIDATKLTKIENVLYGVDAPAFSTASTYAVGDYVTYSDLVYKCKTAVTTAGAWDSSKWDEICDSSTHTITTFDATKTYAVGDYVYHDSTAYRCKTAITVAAAWDATKWESVVVETLGPRLLLPDEIYTLLSA